MFDVLGSYSEINNMYMYTVLIANYFMEYSYKNNGIMPLAKHLSFDN